MTPVEVGARGGGPTAMFHREGDHFRPTSAAVGPWSAQALHGSAVSALIAGFLAHDDSTLACLQIDLLAPVPLVPLRLSVDPRVGRGRVTRQVAALFAGDDAVVQARSLCIRRTDLDVPAAASALSAELDEPATPDLDALGTGRSDRIPWDWFGSQAVATRALVREGANSDMVDLWMRLALPIVEGTTITGVQRAVAAADYGSTGLRGTLPHDQWTFPNADLMVQLSREPVGHWVRLSCHGLVQPVGVGLTSSTLFDSAGRLGQAAQTLVVGKRRGS